MFSVAVDTVFLGAADTVLMVKKWILQLEPAFSFLSGINQPGSSSYARQLTGSFIHPLLSMYSYTFRYPQLPKNSRASPVTSPLHALQVP
jgi:hypothetical protein